ncbi:MAG: transcriptional repressor [Hyphomicrobiales bacterium]|nr:transcriptional repressor [Hyphomicrobiales bacterium]
MRHTGKACACGRDHGAPERLTAGRRAALAILEREARALGAYELIDLMAAQDGRRPAPTQVYRALDYLVENGYAHRLASQNAYLACKYAHGEAEPVAFLICEACGAVVEATSGALSAEIAAVGALAGFHARAQIIEIAGLCAACRDGARPPKGRPESSKVLDAHD